MLISIVSHQQLDLALPALQDVHAWLAPEDEIILTLNTPEDETALQAWLHLAHRPIRIVRNAKPLGFGANHNQAFGQAPCDVFVVMNPDIRCAGLDRSLLLNGFGQLALRADSPRVDATPASMGTLLHPTESTRPGAIAPVVMGPDGSVQDSVRKWPTLARFVGRLWDRLLARPRTPDYSWGDTPIAVDWAAGMFVAFDARAFKSVGGFDEGYFMYLEDADIGRRLARAGWSTVLMPGLEVVHDARRASFRSMQHMAWHLASAWRFLRSG